MGTELEIKMRVDTLAPTREALQKAGATRIAHVKETNSFFDRSDRELLNNGSGLRIRSEVPVEGGDQRTRITFKGPRIAADAPRREVEFMASDCDSATELLEAVGFTRMLSFEKTRESWTLGGCEIELDDVPELGLFVEIEGHELAAIQKIREQLHLASLPLIKQGYAEMIAKKPSR